MSQVRWPPAVEQEVALFPDFDDTMTTGIDDTMRNLRVLDLKGQSRSVEYQNFHLQATRELTAEVAAMRKELAKAVQTINLKASKGQLDKVSVQLTEKIDQRLDTIRNWAGIGIAVMGIVLTLLKAKG